MRSVIPQEFWSSRIGILGTAYSTAGASRNQGSDRLADGGKLLRFKKMLHSALSVIVACDPLREYGSSNGILPGVHQLVKHAEAILYGGKSFAVDLLHWAETPRRRSQEDFVELLEFFDRE